MLTDKQIKEFQEIYRHYYGKEISREEANEQGTKLIHLIKLIYKPITVEQLQALEKRRKEMRSRWER